MHADVEVSSLPSWAAEVTAAVAAACPGFRLDGRPLRARKSVLVPGRLDGQRVMAKLARRHEPDGPWRWYAVREAQLYAHFASRPPPVRVPALHVVDLDRGVLVLERLDGAPLATLRHAAAPIGADVLATLLALPAGLAAWGVDAPPPVPPTPAQHARLRAGLLEEPGAAHQWTADGIDLCVRRGLVPTPAGAAMRAALADGPVAFGHGDLLLRNVLVGADGLALIDWECGGVHHAEWDLALLAIQLGAEQRAVVAAHLERDAGRTRRWRALCAFALAREVQFRARWGDDTDETRRLRAELAAACDAVT